MESLEQDVIDALEAERSDESDIATLSYVGSDVGSRHILVAENESPKPKRKKKNKKKHKIATKIKVVDQ